MFQQLRSRVALRLKPTRLMVGHEETGRKLASFRLAVTQALNQFTIADYTSTELECGRDDRNDSLRELLIPQGLHRIDGSSTAGWNVGCQD